MPLGLTGQEFWPVYNFSVFAWKPVDSILWGPRNYWKNFWKGKKKPIKICLKMPLGPTGQEFWPKYNFDGFAQKLVDSIFRSPRHNWKNLLQEKKYNNSIKNCTSNKFWPKYNFSIFARKPVDSILWGPRK